MVGTPWFCAVCRASVALGQRVKALEHNFNRYVTFVFGQYFFAEVLLEVFAYYENNLAESGVYGIVDRIVHDGFAVGSESVKLFETSVAAAHAGSKNK